MEQSVEFQTSSSAFVQDVCDRPQSISRHQEPRAMKADVETGNDANDNNNDEEEEDDNDAKIDKKNNAVTWACESSMTPMETPTPLRDAHSDGECGDKDYDNEEDDEPLFPAAPMDGLDPKNAKRKADISKGSGNGSATWWKDLWDNIADTGTAFMPNTIFGKKSPAMEEQRPLSSQDPAMILALEALRKGLVVQSRRDPSKDSLEQQSRSDWECEMMLEDKKIKLEVRFVAHAHIHFACLRKCFGILDHDIMESFRMDAGEMIELRPSTSKSGRCFFLTPNRKFVVKTVTRQEGMFLLDILHPFCQHMLANPSSLMPHYCGLFTTQPRWGRVSIFVVMPNVFHSKNPINFRYDLKGSVVGRSSEGSTKAGSSDDDVLKDLDLKQPIFLGPIWKSLFMHQIEADCSFLERMGIIDYSLLMGMHVVNTDDTFKSTPFYSSRLIEMQPDQLDVLSTISSVLILLVVAHGDATTRELFEEVASLLIEVTQNSDNFDGTINYVDLGKCSPFVASSLRVVALPTVILMSGGIEIDRIVGIPTKEELQSRIDRCSASTISPFHSRICVGPCVSLFQKDFGGICCDSRYEYHFGIVDILTPWNIKKQLEHTFKSFLQKKEQMTIIEPPHYAQRIIRFIRGSIQ